MTKLGVPVEKVQLAESKKSYGTNGISCGHFIVEWIRVGSGKSSQNYFQRFSKQNFKNPYTSLQTNRSTTIPTFTDH
jgi:hypothetical protein